MSEDRENTYEPKDEEDGVGTSASAETTSTQFHSIETGQFSSDDTSSFRTAQDQVEDDGSSQNSDLVEIIEVESRGSDSIGEIDSDSDEEDVIVGEEHLEEEIEEDEEEEEIAELDEIEYNISLPAEHQYLGTPVAATADVPNPNDDTADSFEERSFWPDQSRVNLILIPISVFLVPGQTIPLQIAENSWSTTSLMLQQIREEGKRMFGAVHLGSERHQLFLNQTWSGIGISVEIVNTASNNAEGNVGLKCIGRQKFRVLNTRQINRTIIQATVKIIEDFAPCPIKGSDNKPSSFIRYGAWPMWVYRQHDCFWYVSKIKEEIKDLNSKVNLDQAPNDPVKFSYWIICAIPFKQIERMHFLLDKHVFSRLRSQYKTILEIKKNQYYFCCKVCSYLQEIEIAKFGKVFSMSADGPSASYVNPHGYLHETITVYSAKHVLSRGTPTARDSWFPGYLWTIIVCGNCRQHLGWKFTASEPHLKPPKFFGLTSQSLILRKEMPVSAPEPADFSEFFDDLQM